MAMVVSSLLYAKKSRLGFEGVNAFWGEKKQLYCMTQMLLPVQQVSRCSAVNPYDVPSRFAVNGSL